MLSMPSAAVLVLSFDMVVKNVSAWRLNKAELAELAARVAKGEDEAVVKREMQTKKAEANEERKKAANAVAEKCKRQAVAAKAKAKAKAKAGGTQPQSASGGVAAPSDADLNDATNKAYYCQVQEDCEVILQEFGGEAFRKELPLPISGGNGPSGVQEPFDRSKALQALKAHGCYRSRVSVWWLNALQSPTPGVPMSRRRVEDLMEFYYGPEGQPRFHSDRMIEVAVTSSECDTDIPANLQVISPEEVLHATLAGCALAVKFLVLVILFCFELFPLNICCFYFFFWGGSYC